MNSRTKKSKDKKVKPEKPTPVTGKATPKTVTKTVPTTNRSSHKDVLMRRFINGLRDSTETGVVADPYEVEEVLQGLKKKDTTSFVINGAGGITDQNVAASDLTTELGSGVHRLQWVQPMGYRNASGSYETDARGTLSSLDNASVHFKNVSQLTVEVRGNTPKALAGQQGGVSVRTNQFTKVLKPGQSFTVKPRWTSGQRNTPCVRTIVGGVDSSVSKTCAVILDYCVIKPQKDDYNQEDVNDDLELLRITAEVDYTVETNLVGEAYVITSTEHFMSQKLPTFAKMYLVDGDVYGLGAVTSQRMISAPEGNNLHLVSAVEGDVTDNDGTKRNILCYNDGSSYVPVTTMGATPGDCFILPLPYYANDSADNSFNCSMMFLRECEPISTRYNGVTFSVPAGNYWCMASDWNYGSPTVLESGEAMGGLYGQNYHDSIAVMYFSSVSSGLNLTPGQAKALKKAYNAEITLGQILETATTIIDVVSLFA